LPQRSQSAQRNVIPAWFQPESKDFISSKHGLMAAAKKPVIPERFYRGSGVSSSLIKHHIPNNGII
jgi:hypothetical protein